MSKSVKHSMGQRLIALTNGHVAIIDAEDFEKVAPFNWYAKKTGQDDGKVYAAQSQRDGREVRTIYMHRFIMDCPDGKEVDHKNRHRLDNRRVNLEIVTRQENIRRRGGRGKCK